MGPRKYLIQEKNIPQLIEEVKKRDCIWNSEHETYNDRYLTAVAWREISQAMDQQEDTLRAKWKNLRDLFRRDLKKFKCLDSVDAYKGKWRYFENMWFIHKPGDVVAEDKEEENGDSNIEETFLEEFDEDSVAYVKCEPQIDTEVEIDRLELETGRKRKRESDKYEEEGDFDMMYLKSLTPYFRQLDPIRKLIVRSKIQDILINEIAAQAQANKNYS